MVAAGDKVRALDLRTIVPTTLVKSVSQDRINTTTHADDAELFGLALDVGTWSIIADLMMIGVAGGIAIKTRWTFTGTFGTPVRQCFGPTATNTAIPTAAVSLQSAGYNAGTDCIYGLSTSGIWMCVREVCHQVVVTAPGNFAISWAPNVSAANSGGLRAGSAVSARKIA